MLNNLAIDTQMRNRVKIQCLPLNLDFRSKHRFIGINYNLLVRIMSKQLARSVLYVRHLNVVGFALSVYEGLFKHQSKSYKGQFYSQRQVKNSLVC